MPSSIYFVGTGPTMRPEWLVKEAWDVLKQADNVLVVDDAWAPDAIWPWHAQKEYVSSEEVLDHLTNLSSQERKIAVMLAQSPSHHAHMSLWVNWAISHNVMGTIVPGLWDMMVALDTNGFYVMESLEVIHATRPVRIKGGKGDFTPTHTWHLLPSGQWHLDDGNDNAKTMPTLTIKTREIVPHFWSTRLPLYSRKILLLHAGNATLKASSRLQELGATVFMSPVNKIAGPSDPAYVEQTLSHIERYDWVIFTSQEAVARFFQNLKRLNLDIRRMRAQIAVVGPQTAAVLQDYGIFPTLMPKRQFTQEGLAQALSSYTLLGTNVLMPQGNLNRSYLQDYLMQQGALITCLTLYQNIPVPISPRMRDMVERHIVDAIFYTASSSVEHLIEQHPHLIPSLQRIPAISIGPLTSRTLQHYGIPVIRQPEHSSLDAMIDRVIDYFTEE